MAAQTRSRNDVNVSMGLNLSPLEKDLRTAKAKLKEFSAGETAAAKNHQAVEAKTLKILKEQTKELKTQVAQRGRKGRYDPAKTTGNVYKIEKAIQGLYKQRSKLLGKIVTARQMILQRSQETFSADLNGVRALKLQLSTLRNIRTERTAIAKLASRASNTSTSRQQANAAPRQNRIGRSLSANQLGRTPLQEELRATLGNFSIGYAMHGLILAGQDFLRYQRAMYAVSPNEQEYIDNMAFTQALANKTGTNQVELGKSYANFIAANPTDGTGISKSDMERGFKAVTERTMGLGGTQDDAKGSLLAITQMLSKGTISSEELKQQLGERMAGAIDIMATATGRTSSELQKAMENGESISAIDLPKFFREVERRNVRDNLQFDTAAISWGRFRNTIQREMGNVMNSGLDKALSMSIQGLTEFAESISSVLTIFTPVFTWLSQGFQDAATGINVVVQNLIMGAYVMIGRIRMFMTQFMDINFGDIFANNLDDNDFTGTVSRVFGAALASAIAVKITKVLLGKDSFIRKRLGGKGSISEALGGCCCGGGGMDAPERNRKSPKTKTPSGGGGKGVWAKALAKARLYWGITQTYLSSLELGWLSSLATGGTTALTGLGSALYSTSLNKGEDGTVNGAPTSLVNPKKVAELKKQTSEQAQLQSTLNAQTQGAMFHVILEDRTSNGIEYTSQMSSDADTGY